HHGTENRKTVRLHARLPHESSVPKIRRGGSSAWPCASSAQVLVAVSPRGAPGTCSVARLRCRPSLDVGPAQTKHLRRRKRRSSSCSRSASRETAREPSA